MRFILIIILISLGHEAFAVGWPYKEPGVVRKSELAQKAKAQLDIAKRVLREARRKDRSNRQLRAMARKAYSAEIWDASAHEICKAGAAMRAEEGGKRIYICSNFILPWLTPEMKLQMILHEVSHLTGVGGGPDECKADTMARDAMAAVGIPSAPSGYDTFCDLEGLY